MTPSLRKALGLAVAGSLASVVALAVAVGPATGQSATSEEDPLPSGVVIDIDAPEDRMFHIGIPDLGGVPARGALAGEVLRTDFGLMPGYDVLDPRGFSREITTAGLDVHAGQWSGTGADGVVSGEVRSLGERFELELRFYWFGHGTAPALARTYEGGEASLRTHLHDFANAILETVTGRPGPFGTKMVFSRRESPGQKDVYCADMDGYGVHRLSPPRGISNMPAFGLGRVWFTRMTPTGMFITHHQAQDRRIITSDGINMAPAVCDDRRVYFTSSRDGNSEIYSAAEDGTDVRRLTNDPAMDLSPACGPGGTLAFVSTRHRTPQIFLMNRDGSGVRRLTFRGSHNQTPTFCPDPSRRLLAFTGRDDNFDIFTLDLGTNTYARVTQGQGDNTDPAFSRDCRLLAFASTRRGAPGVYVASPSGAHQRRVIEGDAESVRWSTSN
ncbi:MAG: PD40 domain-containing protein [Sandaracinaceae bacterium]|nr:PD40 domain-containing protein [Sandaracinaceae bacterium]